MERRNFLRMMVGGIAVGAAVRTFPFRVFSFATEVQIAPLSIPERLLLRGEDAQFIESRHLDVAEIARIFKIDPEWLRWPIVSLASPI